jgi:hypothetical protein
VAAALALAPPLVNQASQWLEDAGKAMYLIEDNQALFVLPEIEFRVGELARSEGSSKSR